MTNSFRPQAAPVDTFVQPVSVAPPSDLDVLARALETINPGIQAFLEHKTGEAIEDEQQKGIEIAYDELLDDGSLKKVVNKIKKKDGEEAARQLIGGSIFSQKAYERTKAKLTGQNLSTNINNNYSSKTFTVIENGQEVIRPIYHFSASSPEFQSFLAESFNNENLLEGISTKYKNEIFQPYQYQAIQKITQHHQKEHNKYNIEKRKGQLSEVLLTNYLDYQDGKPDQAIGNIQQYIEETVNLGLSDVVKPDELIEIAKNHMSRIYEINEREKPGTGYNAAMNYLNMIGQIKHGPKELQKDGTYKQRLLVDSLGEDILKYKVELGDIEDKLVSREAAKLEAIEETDIINTITENPNSYSIANELLKKYPNRREFLFDQIEIYAGDRDEEFNDFNYKVGTGYYGNDRVKMFTDLDAIKDKIGATWTDEDEQRFKLSAKIARESVSKRNIGSFEPRIKDMHRDVRALLGGTGEDNSYFGKDKEKIATQYIDLKNNVNRRIMDEITLVPDLTPKEREDRFREIQAQYFKDAQAINEGTYEPKGTFLTKEQKAKEAKRQAGIQALVDEYGFGTEDATKIYDQQLNSQEFKDSQEEEKKEEPEKKEESSDKEKSWIQLLLDGLKGKDNDELVSQLNDAKQNLGESETGVIDSVLNALMGSVTAGDLEDNLNIYTVKEGDNLSTIADQFSIDLDDLVEANDIENPSLIQPKDKLIIPPPRRDVLSEYKGKAIPDFGGLAKLVRSGESRGHGSYNAFNKGTTNTAGTMDITSKTIAEMEQLQADGKVSAVGAYQFTPGVLTEVREYAGIEADAIMTPAVQDKLFSALLLSGKKKTILTDYLLGDSDDLRAAHEALALEFAALQGPDGVGMYDKDKAGNIATIEADKVKQALIKARKELSNK